MANLVTLFRFILLYILVALAYQGPAWQAVASGLLAVGFGLDAVDGYLARKYGEESLFGALFDIAVDRIVENVMWLVLADLELIPAWVAIVFITRGFLVDSLRAHAASQGQSPFGMMASPFGRFLVSGRFMRVAYAVLKAVSFCYILVLPGLAVWQSELWNARATAFLTAKYALVYVTVAVCLLRGLPVIAEFVIREDGPFAKLRRHGA